MREAASPGVETCVPATAHFADAGWSLWLTISYCKYSSRLTLFFENKITRCLHGTCINPLVFRGLTGLGVYIVTPEAGNKQNIVSQKVEEKSP